MKTLFTENEDVEAKNVVKAFESTLEEANKITIPQLRENWIISNAGIYLKAIKETKPFNFLVMGNSFTQTKAGKFQVKINGFFIEETEINGVKSQKRAPAILRMDTAVLDEANAFLKGCNRMYIYTILLAVTNDKKVDFARDYKNPNIFYGNGLTRFDTVYKKPSMKATLVALYKEMYGVDVKITVESGTSPAGVSDRQKGNPVFANESDVKAIIFAPTSRDGPRPTSKERGYIINGYALDDNSETFSFFMYDDPALIDITSQDLFIGFGPVSKSTNSTYSDYTMNMIAMQKVSLNDYNKYIR